jgi:D-alanyl-D-alanine carboxypeptidase
MLRSLLAWASLTALASVHCFAETPAPAAAPASIPTAPQVDARAYIVVDYRTDKILAAKDAVAREEPASLTKLMTAYIVFQELAAGKLKLNEQVTVSEHAWRSEGSRTFIELGKPVSVEDLILGMIVQSGNDATIALAERIAGTEETFAQMMNANGKRLKMVGSHFENSSGLPSPQHYTTARDLSLLANAMIREYPQYYKWFSVREFEHNGIKQQNRNGLLGKGSHCRRPEDRTHGLSGLLPGDFRAARRHAAGIGGHGIEQHEGARECQRRAPQLRVHVLRHQAGGQRRRRAGDRAGLEGTEPLGGSRHQGGSLRHPAARRSRPTSRRPPTSSRDLIAPFERT